MKLKSPNRFWEEGNYIYIQFRIFLDGNKSSHNFLHNKKVAISYLCFWRTKLDHENQMTALKWCVNIQFTDEPQSLLTQLLCYLSVAPWQNVSIIFNFCSQPDTVSRTHLDTHQARRGAGTSLEAMIFFFCPSSCWARWTSSQIEFFTPLCLCELVRH